KGDPAPSTVSKNRTAEGGLWHLALFREIAADQLSARARLVALPERLQTGHGAQGHDGGRLPAGGFEPWGRLAGRTALCHARRERGGRCQNSAPHRRLLD